MSLAGERSRAPPRGSSLLALRSGGTSSYPYHDVLDLRIVLQRQESSLSPDPALLVAAERGSRTAREVLVDHDVARLDVSREPHRLVDVGGKDPGCEAVV